MVIFLNFPVVLDSLQFKLKFVIVPHFWHDAWYHYHALCII